MRPSGTVGAALLVLLAAHFPAGLALEEKKGKGVPAAPRPALRRPEDGFAFGRDRGRDTALRFWSVRACGGPRSELRARGSLCGTPRSARNFPHFPALPRGAGGRPGKCAPGASGRTGRTPATLRVPPGLPRTESSPDS